VILRWYRRRVERDLRERIAIWMDILIAEHKKRPGYSDDYLERLAVLHEVRNKMREEEDWL